MNFIRPITFLIYSVSAYVAHIVIMDLITFFIR